MTASTTVVPPRSTGLNLLVRAVWFSGAVMTLLRYG
jgi:hypothetical protein